MLDIATALSLLYSALFYLDSDNSPSSLRWLNTVFKSLYLIHHYFLAIHALVPIFARLTTEEFILAFWPRGVLLAWQQG